MIEAMACGTPVIAYRSGSVPEVVENGVTGFIVENEEQAVRAVGDLGRLDRRKVRARFEERFSADRMAREYECAYRKLISAAAEHSATASRRRQNVGSDEDGRPTAGLQLTDFSRPFESASLTSIRRPFGW
jgi:hypothetical protein